MKPQLPYGVPPKIWRVGFNYKSRCGNMRRAFARLIESQPYPLTIAGIHTSTTAPAKNADVFLDRVECWIQSGHP